MAITIRLKRSSTPSKRPQIASLSLGELAINDADSSPGLFFKTSNNNLIKIGPVGVGDAPPNSVPASGGSSGNCVGEVWYNSLENSFNIYVSPGWAKVPCIPQPVGNFPLDSYSTKPLYSWGMRQVRYNPVSTVAGMFTCESYPDSIQTIPLTTDQSRTNVLMDEFASGGDKVTMNRWFSQGGNNSYLVGEGVVLDVNSIAGPNPAKCGASYGPQFPTSSNSPLRTSTPPSSVVTGGASWFIVQFGAWNVVPNAVLFQITGNTYDDAPGSLIVKREGATRTVRIYKRDASNSTWVPISDVLAVNDTLGSQNTLAWVCSGNNVGSPTAVYLNGDISAGQANSAPNYISGIVSIGGTAAVNNAVNWGEGNPVPFFAYGVYNVGFPPLDPLAMADTLERQILG